MELLMVVIKIIATVIIALLAGLFAMALYAFAVAEYKMYRRPLRQIYEQRKGQSDYCCLDCINSRYIEMLILKEDDTFYSHGGLRPTRIYRSFKYNLRHRRIITSGSTITQQLLKNLYFHFNKSMLRKLPEALMALKAEKILNKDEILELYINIVYYGCGIYGLADAAEYYFSRQPDELTFNQMFMIIQFLNGPTTKNPLLHPDVFEIYHRILLHQWGRAGILSYEEVVTVMDNLAHGLDPCLRKSEDSDSKFDNAILINERFGIETDFGVRRKKTHAD